MNLWVLRPLAPAKCRVVTFALWPAALGLITIVIRARSDSVNRSFVPVLAENFDDASATCDSVGRGALVLNMRSEPSVVPAALVATRR